MLVCNVLHFVVSPNRENAAFLINTVFNVKKSLTLANLRAGGSLYVKRGPKMDKERSYIINGQHLVERYFEKICLKLQLLYQLNCLFCLYHHTTTKIILALQLYWCFFQKVHLLISQKSPSKFAFVCQSRMNVLRAQTTVNYPGELFEFKILTKEIYEW